MDSSTLWRSWQVVSPRFQFQEDAWTVGWQPGRLENMCPLSTQRLYISPPLAINQSNIFFYIKKIYQYKYISLPSIALYTTPIPLHTSLIPFKFTPIPMNSLGKSKQDGYSQRCNRQKRNTSQDFSFSIQETQNPHYPHYTQYQQNITKSWCNDPTTKYNCMFFQMISKIDVQF